MKKIIPQLFCFATLSSLVASADDLPQFTVKPVRFTCVAPLPDALSPAMKSLAAGGPFASFPMLDAKKEDASKTRCEAVFLVSGSGLIAVHSESLKLDRIATPDGADISRDYRGLATFTAGREGHVSEDGKFGMFSVNLATDAPVVSPLVFKGSIRLKTSAKAETATHTAQLPLAEAESVKLGPFDVTLTTQRQNLRVKLAGPRELLASLEITVDGQKISKSSSRVSSSGVNASFTITTHGTETSTKSGVTTTTFNNSANASVMDMVDALSTTMKSDGDNMDNYTFTLPKDATKANLTLTYWSDPQDQTLPFEATVF